MFNFIRGLWNKNVLADNIIKANEKCYYKSRKKFPDEDEHFYLASTWGSRYRLTHLSKLALHGMAWAETYPFAVLDPPDSIRALALYIVGKELGAGYKQMGSEAFLEPSFSGPYSELGKEYKRKFSEEFNTITLPVRKMFKDKTFWDVYKKKNPRLAKQMGANYPPTFGPLPHPLEQIKK